MSALPNNPYQTNGLPGTTFGGLLPPPMPNYTTPKTTPQVGGVQAVLPPQSQTLQQLVSSVGQAASAQAPSQYYMSGGPGVSGSWVFHPSGSGGFSPGSAVGQGGVPRWMGQPQNPQVPGTTNILDAGVAAAMSDSQRTQQAADQQWAAVNQAAQGVLQAGQRAPGLAQQATGQAVGVLQNRGQQVVGQGNQQLADVQKMLTGFLDKVEKSQKDTFNNFKDLTAQEASSTALGIQQSWQNATAMATKGIGPDGMPMSPEAQQEAIFSAKQAAGQQTQQALTAIYSNYNNTMASLRQTATSQSIQAYGTALGALNEGYAGARAAQGLASNLDAQAASIINAAPFTALQWEMQGNMAYANMIRDNPRSVVSQFATIASLAQMATMRGIGNIRLNVGSLGGGRG